MKSLYCYSPSLDEPFKGGNFQTREEAVQAAIDNLPLAIGDKFHTGLLVPYMPSVNVDWLLSFLKGQAADYCEDSAEGWLDAVTPEQKSDLQAKTTFLLRPWRKC